MPKWIRWTVGVTITTVLAAATLVGGLSTVVPDVHEFLTEHAIWSWAAIIICAIVVGVLWHRVNALGDQLAKAREDLEASTKANADLARDRAAEREKSAVLSRERDRLSAALEAQKAQSVALERTLKPKSNDQQLFDDVMTTLPWDRGAMVWLESGVVKQWTDDTVRGLISAADHWDKKFMADPSGMEAFDALRSAIDAMVKWMGDEGSPTDRSVSQAGVDGSWTYVIKRGDARPGPNGWDDYQSAIRTGEILANNVVQARQEFEVICVNLGLTKSV